MRLGSKKDAELVARAVGVDNGDYVSMTIEGRRIESEIRSDSLGQALSTVDDLLAAVTVALGVRNAAKTRKR
jgi:hypothetical protein